MEITESLKGVLFRIHKSLDGAVALGLNDAAHDILQHIQAAVPVRTGALRDSYRITREATPDSPRVTIGNEPELPYAKLYYPVTLNFGVRPRIEQARPQLFGTPQADEARGDLVRRKVAERIAAIGR